MPAKSKRPRCGIVQGRLTQAPPGKLQWFPQQGWEREFNLASTLGLDFIELIAEREDNPANPLWSDNGAERIRELVAANDLSLYAFCTDYTIDNAITENADVLSHSLRLLDRGAALGCEVFVLPLFEKSRLTPGNVSAFVPAIRAIADKAADNAIQVCLETELPAKELLDALDKFDRSSISVVFDTGNRVAFGHDLAADIGLLGNRIRHVHVKDKNPDNQNVLLGTGLVNFLQVFDALAAISYGGRYTFETQRGKDPVRTAAYNLQVLHYFHQEASSE